MIYYKGQKNMLSRIQDLPRFKADMKRFQLGIDSTSSETYDKGIRCLEALITAVRAFDGATTGLIQKEGHSTHMDHVSAQEAVRIAKDDMESWMIQYAPNIHVNVLEFEPKVDSIEMAK